ncbi:hypothetical protein BZG36_02842 [Bifiguratus adelaidae]|uniref:Uncharacterized protein n=1 Tax=Bifiguratus adelaidae TaxID=1938954 RepID=A0A261Y0M4_9FUNG|nr:hypothetical protein BZG36_02842 [Bifiguratus adelaidae]
MAHERLTVVDMIRWLTSHAKLSVTEAMECSKSLLNAGYDSFDRLGDKVTEEELKPVVKKAKLRKAIVQAAKGLSDQGTSTGKPASPSKKSSVFKDDPRAIEIKFATDIERIKAFEMNINRAPVMNAWAAIVALRSGYQWAEALSLAKVYTELNARAKGQSLGIIQEKDNKTEPLLLQSNAVMLMGRLIPAKKVQMTLSTEPQYRAMSSDDYPVHPRASLDYLERSFGGRDQLALVLGGMDVLAKSLSQDELQLSTIPYQLYEKFRPFVEFGVKGWGAKGKLSMATVVGLAQKGNETKS